MKKHLIRAAILCVALFMLVICAWKDAGRPDGQIPTDVVANERMAWETIMKSAPVVSYVDSHTIQIRFPAETDKWYCTYYDTSQDRFSERYETPLAAKYGLIAYVDDGTAAGGAGEAVLVVRDIFEKDSYYEEFALDMEPAQLSDVLCETVFLNQDFLCMLYQPKDSGEEMLCILDLRNSSVKTATLSQKIYPVDPILYDDRTEQEYKEAFYEAITDQVVMEVCGGRAVYFRDYFQGANNLNDLSYLFLDCDKDGLLELVMSGFAESGGRYSDAYCVLKYVPEDERVVLSYKQYGDWMLLGSGQWGCYSSSPHKYRYRTMDAQGEEDVNIFFEIYHWDEKKTEYLMGVGATGYFIGRKEWEEFSQDLRELVEHPLEMTSFSEAFGEGFVPEAVDEGEAYFQWLYDNTSDFDSNMHLPYADETTFETIKDAYAGITFRGEFLQGDPEIQEERKRGFLRLLRNEIPFLDEETGEQIYLKDFGELTGDSELDITTCIYCFFDADDDGVPELGISRDRYGSEDYYFKYDIETGECVLWYEISGWDMWFGSGKLANPWGGGQYRIFVQLGEDGETECETYGFSTYYSEEETLHMIMMPAYEDETREVAVTEEMMKQGVFCRSKGQWFFRLTEEQYEKVTEEYMKAYSYAYDDMEDVTYTYEELFGDITGTDTDFASLSGL